MVNFNNVYYFLGTAIACLISYLIGSLNASIIISKLIYKTDIRKYHSQNAGASNINRTFGFKIGILVLFLDSLKVTLSMLLTFLISLVFFNNENATFSQISYYIPVIFVAIGHAYPVFFKFKGGKCVSVVLGFTMMINPIYFVILFGVYWILLLSTKYVSIASVFGMVILGIIIWIPYISGLSGFINTPDELFNNKFLYFNLLHKFTHEYKGTHYYDNLLLINISLEIILIFTIFLHKSNIKKLIKREEYKFSFNKNNKKRVLKEESNITETNKTPLLKEEETNINQNKDKNIEK